MKVVENSPQNATTFAPFLKIFLGGLLPNPPGKDSQLCCSRHVMYIQNPRNFEVGPPPPLRNPAYAPDVIM